jgi:hypothetical protein
MCEPESITTDYTSYPETPNHLGVSRFMYRLDLKFGLQNPDPL